MPSKISLGNVEITTPKTQPRRMSTIIWGPSGSGKTTLAATAPRPILWVNLDPDGTSSLMDQEGIYIADMSTENPNVVMRFKREDCANIASFIKENPDIKTVVLDSVTSLNDMALRHGVSEVRGATMEMPTLQGYGRRNSYTLQAVTQFIKVTGQYDKHCILIAHEDTPQKDELTGQVLVSILVGGKLQSEIPIKLSEVWHLQDTGKDRKITIRSSRLRKPMKSRMIIQSDKGDFTWDFDPESWKGEGIEEWYEKWVDNNGRKIKLP